MHLTDDSYRRLVEGAMPSKEARALALHLRMPCEACEAYLAARPRADALDGLVDRALLSLAPPAPGVRANHRAPIGVEQAPRVPARRRRWLPGLAVAATLAVAGLAALLGRPSPATGPAWDGEKGSAAAAVPLRLRFLVLTPGVGGPPALERGVPGQEVPSSASLQFQLELGRPAHVLLARLGGGAAPEVFFSARLGAGRHVVSVDGEPAAYPLASLSGAQRFLALASEAPLSPADAARAAAAAGSAGLEGDRPITLDEVEVRVRP
jgi:hypothetical protein